VLSASIEYDITLASLARLLVPTFAIYCIVDIVDADGQIRRIANEHADPTKQPLLRELGQRYSPDWNSPHPAAYTLRTGEPRMFTHLDPSATRDSAHLQLLTDLDTGAWMVVPLIAHTRIIGTLTMVQSTSRPSYTHDDLQFALDLANRAALVVENARLYHEAQQAIRARDQFLSIASHELKTPLTTLLGNAQLLDRRLRDVPLPIERERRSTNVIVEQARRLNRMVDTLLDVSRIETGQMKIERRPVHLVKLVERVAAEIQLISSNHELRLSKPEAVLIVDGDELRLEQVFQNLIQNAIKYSPQGGLIELTFGRTNDHAVVSISDQGIGIPSSAIPQLFSRFYRAANADPTHISGMGIGLFVVREIVTQHNGHIGVRSVEGQGSTFTVELPLIANHE
jgi:signal transduction histidine kinase